MNEQKFKELVCSALSEERQPAEEEKSTGGMTSFFCTMAELRKSIPLDETDRGMQMNM